MRLPSCCWIVFCLLHSSGAWDADDLALFDVIEDVNRNFYEFLEVEQSAAPNEIRRAYRRLSLQLHPDKNKEPDAENQFRKLVAAYEVLKDDKSRAKYNEVLVTGLPDWRQPVYYFRKVRKMGLMESSVLISVILTVGHFSVSWMIYLEKRFVYTNRPKRKKDKKSKKQKTDETEDENVLLSKLEDLVPKPKFSDLLPLLIARGLCCLISKSPNLFLRFLESVKNRNVGPEVEDEEEEDDDKCKARQNRSRPAMNFTYELAEPTRSTQKVVDAVGDEPENTNSSGSLPAQKSGRWKEVEMETLVRAVIRYPGGTSDRWEKISAMVGRPTKEVIEVSKKLKNYDPSVMSERNANVVTKRAVISFVANVDSSSPEVERDPGSTPHKPQTTVPDPTAESIPAVSCRSKPPEAKVVHSTSPAPWTQQQQKSLEAAMNQIQKDNPDRWQRIAELVPGKNKEECLQRVRQLAEMVKKRKMNQGDRQTDAAGSEAPP